MEKSISPKITALAFGVLILSFLVAFYVVAWQEPTAAPPGDNVPTPLNVGLDYQEKLGPLVINRGGAPTGLIVEHGNVGIGTTTPDYTLDVNGSMELSGGSRKIEFGRAGEGGPHGLEFSDELYLYYRTSPNNLEIEHSDGTDILVVDRDNKRVGIGTADPSEELEVQGDVKTNTVTIVGGTSLPTCNASYRGKQFLLQSPSGTEDGLYICKKKADDTYGWVALASPEIEWASIDLDGCRETCKISYLSGGDTSCCCVVGNHCYGWSTVRVTVNADGSRSLYAYGTYRYSAFGGGMSTCCGVTLPAGTHWAGLYEANAEFITW